MPKNTEEIAKLQDRLEGNGPDGICQMDRTVYEIGIGCQAQIEKTQKEIVSNIATLQWTNGGPDTQGGVEYHVFWASKLESVERLTDLRTLREVIFNSPEFKAAALTIEPIKKRLAELRAEDDEIHRKYLVELGAAKQKLRQLQANALHTVEIKAAQERLERLESNIP